MATSGTYTHTINKRELIKNSLIEAGVITDSQNIDGGMWTYMDLRLNLALKWLKTKGLHLWTVKDLTLLLEADKITYTLGGTSSDRCMETLVRSVLTVAGVATDTSIACVTTGMAVSDVIGIELDTGEMHWTTVSAVTDAANVVITTQLPSGVAIGKVVYAYTTIAPKPLRIHEAYLIQKNGETSHTILNVIPREEYQNKNNKSTSGVPNEIYFRPDTLFSELKIQPVSSDNVARIVMSAEYPFSDMTELTDNLSMPDWWHEPIYLWLSYLAAMGYNATDEKVRMIKEAAMIAIFEAENYDVENTYIQIDPEVTW